jgi:cyclopropane fatty-acyl-phospholipid synthase-like methyltransferase
VTALSTTVVASYYDGKTQSLLERYGPGPRVHYHAGIFTDGDGVVADRSPAHLRAQLVASQERLLRYAVESWSAAERLRGDVVDVGCGLGGGSLFLAQEFGTRVTAVTCAPAHVPIVRAFAEKAGVSGQVRVVLQDAADMPGDALFDAAVAVESLCHMPRPAVFRRLSGLLREGGRLFLADYFYEDPMYEKLWREHWCAPIGAVGEYECLGRESGFSVEQVEDISLATLGFWQLTAALIRQEARDRPGGPDEAMTHSLRAHEAVYEGLLDGRLQYQLLSLVRFSRGGEHG